MTAASHNHRLGIAPLQLWLFASIGAAMVGNLYYVQPLLGLIAAQFGTNVAHTGVLVTLVQIGYALGVFFIVPFGDVVDRRRLLTIMLTAAAVGLAVVAASPNLVIFSVASVVVGIASSAAMVVMPFAASLASEEAQGEVVGRVMTGNLVGILLARTVSGTVTQIVGWRPLYVIAALIAVALIFALRTSLPREQRSAGQRYPALMRSLAALLVEQPELRRRAFYGFLAMASFSVLWTGLTFLLSAPPFNYPVATIGLFGLLGALTALLTGRIGKMGDRGRPDLLLVGLSLSLVLSWGLLALGATQLPPIIAGILLLDVSFMGMQVLNSAVIYRLVPEARSRLTSIFITASFIGASTGSAIASLAYEHFAWWGVCAVGVLFPLVLSVLTIQAWSNAKSIERRSGQHSPFQRKVL